MICVSIGVIILECCSRVLHLASAWTRPTYTYLRNDKFHLLTPLQIENEISCFWSCTSDVWYRTCTRGPLINNLVGRMPGGFHLNLSVVLQLKVFFWPVIQRDFMSSGAHLCGIIHPIRWFSCQSAAGKSCEGWGREGRHGEVSLSQVLSRNLKYNRLFLRAP